MIVRDSTLICWICDPGQKQQQPIKWLLQEINPDSIEIIAVGKWNNNSVNPFLLIEWCTRVSFPTNESETMKLAFFPETVVVTIETCLI